MAHAACKWILNNGVQALAKATNERLDDFPVNVVDSLIDLDLAYANAKHLIQVGDEKTFVLAASFSADVAARAAFRAAERAQEFTEE